MSDRSKLWLVWVLVALVVAGGHPAGSGVDTMASEAGPNRSEPAQVESLRRAMNEAQSAEEKREIGRRLFRVLNGLQRESGAPGRAAGARGRNAAASPEVQAPTLSSASLSLEGDVSLSNGSSIFKDGELFIWDEESSMNFALGRRALSNNTIGQGNTAVGTDALAYNDSYYYPGYPPYTPPALYKGSYNTAVGFGAMKYNDGGRDNVAVGYEALNSAVYYSRENTAIGSFAMRNLVQGTRGVAVGSSAMANTSSGTWNTAVGNAAGVDMSYSNNNTAVGHMALANSPYTSSNTAVGSEAMAMTAGNYNSALGKAALKSNTSGTDNVGLGFVALGKNGTGTSNVAVGSNALYHNTTGSNNIAIGGAAGYSLGNNPYGAPLGGSDNILIGNEGVDGDNGAIRIGTAGYHMNAFVAGIYNNPVQGQLVYADNLGRLGSAGGTPSSKRLKKNIEDLSVISYRLHDLRPVSFQHKGVEEPSMQFGLIAEEVADVLPELVVFDDEGAAQAIRYRLLSSLLLAEVQKQQLEIEQLRARVEGLEQ